MKALKVYEALDDIFKPREDLDSIFSNMSFKEIIRFANREFIPNNVSKPLIVEIFQKMRRGEIRGKNGGFILGGYLQRGNLIYSEDLKGEEKYADLLFKYNGKGYVFRQYSDTNFLVPLTKKLNPLFQYKIFDLDDLIKYVDEDNPNE
jgi:hypothetical protein